MDDVTRNRIESFDRCEQWFTDHSAVIGASDKLKTNKNEFVDELALLRTDVGSQTAAISESEEQTDVKFASREDGVDASKLAKPFAIWD